MLQPCIWRTYWLPITGPFTIHRQKDTAFPMAQYHPTKASCLNWIHPPLALSGSYLSDQRIILPLSNQPQLVLTTPNISLYSSTLEASDSPPTIRDLSMKQIPIYTGQPVPSVGQYHGVNKKTFSTITTNDLPPKLKPKLLQLSCHNVRSVGNLAKTEWILDFVSSNNLDIISLCQTWLYGDASDAQCISKFTPSDYQLFHCPCNGRCGGGVGVLHWPLGAKMIPHLSSHHSNVSNWR